MEEKLVISACNFLIPEISQVIKNGDYPDVQLISYPANCSLSALSQKVVSGIVSNTVSDSDVVIIGSLCIPPESGKLKSNNNIDFFALEQCFELVLNSETITYFIKKGCYIVTNGWLRTYEKTIKDWGFDKTSAKSFFGESMKSILMLDTKIPGDYMPSLLSLSDYVGLPYEIIPIGLTHCSKNIDSIVMNWRNDNDRRKLSDKLSVISKKSADHNLIFNQLETLVSLTDEYEIAINAFNLINILFAPTKIVYKYLLNNQEESLEFNGIYNVSEISEENSFDIEIKHAGELFGKYEVIGIQFPKFKRQYKEMSVVISQLFGMAIANARKYSQLEQSKKVISQNEIRLTELNATKDKFFSIIAHDLKSPFNAIIGLSEMLVEMVDMKEYDGIDNYARIILNSSRKAMSLLTNLMDWSRLQTGRIGYNPEIFDLAICINSIILLYNEVADKKAITIETELSSNTPVFADREMINTVIRNLISNAVKFTDFGGKIVISSKKECNQLIVSVKDNGVGIPADRVKKLFSIEESSSTSGTASETGTGLGLILCREFIEKHDEKLWVQSEEGRGTTFYFTLKMIID